MISQGLPHEGKIIIQEILKCGKIKKESIVYNRVMNIWLNEVITMLTGTSSNDFEIKYLAFGTSDTPVTDADTTLGNEVFRTPDISLSKIDVGKVESKFFLDDDEALSDIKEIGFFCGSGATATADSGTLLSRILWSKDRTSGATAINFTRIDTIERK